MSVPLFAFPCLILSLCVSQDLISALLPRVLPAVTEGLQDLDDDVRAVAASALIPVVEGLVQLLPSEVRTSVYIVELGRIRSFRLHVFLKNGIHVMGTRV